RTKQLGFMKADIYPRLVRPLQLKLWGPIRQPALPRILPFAMAFDAVRLSKYALRDADCRSPY
ncbi:MAG TPA: hypothetical protein VFH87_04030, partial [Candidatus Udaeobacter sp.]|nr:hypothetical protein [Candidatus Udaeobacter sp.]